MSSIELTRHIAADPASVALLLAGPITDAETSGELRLVTTDGHAAGIAIAPPRRAGVGFTAELDIAVDSGAVGHGAVTVLPADDAGCEVSLLVLPASDDAVRALSRTARRFLDDLDARARSRAFAA